MLDAPLRRAITPGLERVGSYLARGALSANLTTVGGFVFGILGCVAIAMQFYFLGLGLILVNRAADILDGLIARKRDGTTDYGGYLDIVLDFFIYSAVPCAFVFANPANGAAGALLMLSFMGTGASFLAYAIICAKRGISTEERGKKSFYYLGGLVESVETTLFFAAFCIWPAYFVPLAYILAIICLLTFALRVYEASRQFNS